ncbi:hypothetical protein [Teredinibacter franksiae]|uniref:hypothetical protein n=1 Tax=Teredinibacter franksiae TaxID=2761453 RepID=UPI001624F361|nr:hypothetical protein [Teredinibacter franksiae]
MQASNIYLIATAEVAVLLLLICVFLLLQNRSLRGLVKKLQLRMEQLVVDLRAARSAAKTSKEESSAKDVGYKQMLNKQLDFIREHHDRLDAGQDLVLDLDPETPLPRRVAALRYAILQAEKEATANKLNDHADWKVLQSRYEKLFDYQAVYTQAPEAGVYPEEMDALLQELTAAKKRVQNLERFKALYFDLEQQWESSKENAQVHMSQISELTAEAENSNEIEQVLKAYQSSYNVFNDILEAGVEGQNILNSSATGEESTSEVRHLRAVAADQHKIITELQRKLRDSNTAEEKELVVNELQGQLQKQIRFVQESETCIQLLEDELTTAHKEVEQLQTRLSQLPALKGSLKELRDQNDEYELQFTAIKSENRRLSSKLKAIEAAPPNDTGNSHKLKKELSELESRYAELEEKFLDLKMSQ